MGYDQGLRGKNSFSYSNDDLLEKAERKNAPYYYPEFKDNIRFILDHFQEPFFPRTISTQESGGRQILMNSIDKIYKEFQKSNFIDCRINAFPAIEKNPVPNFVFIDLDVDHQKNISLDKILRSTLSNIKKRLAGSPTVLWTGNGYHIYQPINCPVSLSTFNELKEFDNPDNLFLRFEKDFLSDRFADKANHPSLKSCLLRVPGSLNSKCLSNGLSKEESTIKVIQNWDGLRPPIKYQIGSFYSHLKSEKMMKEQKEEEFRKSFNSESVVHSISWIEKLLNTPIADYRKLCLWHVLVPYLINVKGLSEQGAFLILESWIKECDKIQKIDFDYKKVIKSNIKSVKDYKPISLANLKIKFPDLYKLVVD